MGSSSADPPSRLLALCHPCRNAPRSPFRTSSMTPSNRFVRRSRPQSIFYKSTHPRRSEGILLFTPAFRLQTPRDFTTGLAVAISICADAKLSINLTFPIWLYPSLARLPVHYRAGVHRLDSRTNSAVYCDRLGYLMYAEMTCGDRRAGSRR